MQDSSGKSMEAIARNPWLVKAGIPLLLSAAAFITSKIISTNREEVQEKCDLVEMLEDLKRREFELENRFLKYQDMKERESKAMEIQNKVCLEMKQLEFLAREASLMEVEARGMEEYLRVVKVVETLRWEKGLVEKKARKMRKRVEEKSKVVKEQRVNLKARDKEIARNGRELERKSEVIVELEDEIRLINGTVDQLKEEMVARSASTKPKEDEEVVTKEAYDAVVEELERAKKGREDMENELIHLKWSNACLKHEVNRCQKEPESSPRQVRKLGDILHIELNGPRLDELHHDNEERCRTQEGRFLRRQRFIGKLKKWVEGRTINEKQKHDEMIKCFAGHSVAHSEEAYENYVHPRNSFSSV